MPSPGKGCEKSMPENTITTTMVAATSKAQRKCRGLALLLTLLISQPGWAQNPAFPPGSSDASSGATAEEILAAFRQTRPSNEVIPSDAQRNRPADRSQRQLLPEGFRVLNLLGTITKVQGWWTLQSGEAQSLGNIRLLYNRSLEQMVHTTAGAPTPVQFAVSGEVTVFKGENFLFPRVANRANLPARPALPTAQKEAAPPEPAVPSDASSDDVLSLLRSQKPEQEILSGVPASSEGGLGTGDATDRMMVQSVPLTQRPGRITGSGEQWLFSFESAADHPSDLPLRVLPNLQLERMISAIENSTMPLVFIVSGEITVFEGTSYLLVRASARRISSGELGK